MMTFIANLIKSVTIHKHRWSTTHENKWLHPTRQVCKCGDAREMKMDKDYAIKNVMPYEKVHWLHADGSTSEYSVLD